MDSGFLAGDMPAATSYSGNPTPVPQETTPATQKFTPAASGPSAEAQIGSTVGGVIGTAYGGPIGGAIGSAAGGALGGAVGGDSGGGGSGVPSSTQMYSPFDASGFTVNFASPGATGASYTASPTLATVQKLAPLLIIAGALLFGVILWKKL